jgi:hypothetical protein
LAAVGIIVGRALTRPLQTLWLDLLSWLALYGLLTLLVRSDKLRNAAAVGISAFLLGVYIWSHGPHLWSALGIAP